LPARFSLYQTFFVTVVVALGIAHVVGHDDLPSGSGATPLDEAPTPVTGLRLPKAGPRSRPRILVQLTMAALAVAAVVSLIPRWPLPTADVSMAMPPFFTSPAANEIPEGSVVLSYPFALWSTDQAMLWQETDHWRWKLMGGYADIPSLGNTVSPWPPALSPIDVQEFLGYWTWPAGGYLVETPPPADSRLVADVRLYVRRYGIGTVIFDPAWGQSAIVSFVLQRALGEPISEGGVDLWFHAQAKAAAP